MSTTMEKPGCTTATSDQRQQPSRVQKRPPALKLAPATANTWKTAIPLLSPLAPSPESTADQQPPVVENQKKDVITTAVVVEKTPVFKKWQHPAAPFCYESSTTFVPPFVVPFV